MNSTSKLVVSSADNQYNAHARCIFKNWRLPLWSVGLGEKRLPTDLYAIWYAWGLYTEYEFSQFYGEVMQVMWELLCFSSAILQRFQQIHPIFRKAGNDLRSRKPWEVLPLTGPPQSHEARLDRSTQSNKIGFLSFQSEGSGGMNMSLHNRVVSYGAGLWTLPLEGFLSLLSWSEAAIYT